MTSELNRALKGFDATQANLEKLERLWSEIESLIPQGVAFGDDPAYENKCRSFRTILGGMPNIGKVQIEDCLMELNEIAQDRMDAIEADMFECKVAVEESIGAQGKELREYRYALDQKRRALIRRRVLELAVEVDELVTSLAELRDNPVYQYNKVDSPIWDRLEDCVGQLDRLFGSSVSRPNRWGYLQRHIAWREMCDLIDIIDDDWPAVKSSLDTVLYGEDDPLPVASKDLAELANTSPTGDVVTKAQWTNLDAEQFERLMFNLISCAPGYENPEWLQKTNAPDRGRDLSVTRIIEDPLGDTMRHRVVVQCKHWTKRSVGPSEVSTCIGLMKTWEHPRVDVLVIATTGRFTADAISIIEQHNHSDVAMRIEMWPDSRLERLLAKNPGIAAEFKLF